MLKIALKLRGVPIIAEAMEVIQPPVGNAIYGASNRREIAKLANSRSDAAKLIAAAATGCHASPDIERQRSRMLSDRRPLVTGDLGPAGIYDRGDTVAGVTLVSKRRRAAEFLAGLVRAFAPTTAIELGTNVGVSSAYIASEMPHGTLTTLESSPYRIAQAKRAHEELGLRNVRYVQGLFKETLPGTLATLGRIDLAFIDGHHQYQPTLDYFEMIYPSTVRGSVVVFDDIRWSEGMRRAWEELQDDQRFSVVVDCQYYGVCVIAGERGEQRLMAGPIRLF